MRFPALLLVLALPLICGACGGGEVEGVDAAMPTARVEVEAAALDAELSDVDLETERPAPAAATTNEVVSELDSTTNRTVVDGSAVVVTVVDATLGLPLAGAQVRAFDVADLDEKDAEKVVDSKLRRKRLWREVEPLLTGADGTVDLPTAREEFYVHAELGNRDAWARTRGADLRFELDTVVPVPLRAVGRDGRAVAGLQLEMTADPDRRVIYAVPGSGLLLEPTDAEGRTAITELQRYRREVMERSLEARFDPNAGEAPPIEELGTDLVLLEPTAPGLGQGTLEVRLSEFTPPAYDLVLPPHGSLRVRLRDAAGQPAAGDQTIEVLAVGDDPSEATSWSAGEDGDVVLPVVGLGRHFEIETVHEAVNVAGPVADGEQVVVDLLGATAAVVIAGRVVDAEGAAVEGTFEVTFAASVGGEWSEVVGEQPATSGADGRIEIAGAWAASAEADARELRLRTSSGPWQGESGVFGSAPLPVDLAPTNFAGGRLDVGEIVVAGASMTTAGSVVEEGGAPIEGAELSLVRALEDGEALEYWRHQRIGHATTDASGRFSFQHLPPRDGATYELHSDSDGAVLGSGSWPVRIGAEDNRVVLPSSGRLALRLEATDGFDLGTCYLTISAEREELWSGVLEDPESERQLRIPHEGNVSLEIMDFDNSLVLAQLGEIPVRLGETTRDPRLLPLRVGGNFGSILLTVVDPQGEPIREAFAALLVPTVDGTSMTGVGNQTDRKGQAELVWTPEAVALNVDKSGYYHVHVTELQSQMHVVLRPGGELRIEVDGALDESEGRFQAYCRRAGINGLGRRLERSGNGFESSMSEPGDYEITWSWQEHGADAITLLDGATSIELLDVPEPQTFVVPTPLPPSDG